jgi:sugar lactone lactonase YvrE
MHEVAVGQVNDLLVDPDGRAYVGSIGMDLRYEALDADFVSRLQPVPLALVQPDGSVGIAADGLLCPNGMALTADGRTLVVAESATSRILAFDRAPDGTLTGRRVFAELDGMPDGLCMDAEGHVWVGLLGAERFARVADGGTVVDEIACPGRSAVDCVLGGEDGRTLYGAVTFTPGTAFSYDGELRGAVESWRVDVPGPGA